MQVMEMAHKATEAAQSHPVASAGAALVASLVAIMQSAQDVVGTLIALVASITSLVLSFNALRGAWRSRNKD